MTKKLSRWKFLGLVAGVDASSALVACAAPAPPQVIGRVAKEIVVIEKEEAKEVQVVRTLIVEMAKEM